MSDDSGIIVISSDEFGEENEDISDNDGDADGSINPNNAIERSHHLPLLKDQGYFECYVVYVYLQCKKYLKF